MVIPGAKICAPILSFRKDVPRATDAPLIAPVRCPSTLLETRVGLRPVGPDIRPLLGPVRGVDGLVVATGLGATGLTMGPLAGAVAARAALGLPPGVDLSPFDPIRS